MAKKTKKYSKHLTILANERTLLAYVRTALTLFVAGVSFIRFFGAELIINVGIVFVIIGVMVLFVGIVRHFLVWKRIKNG